MANDYFTFKAFTIRQSRCGMKVGTDGTLLGAWARGGSRILDVGTGTGLIALMMAQRFPDASIVGIDIDGQAVSQAAENVAASPFAPRVIIRQQDVAASPFAPRVIVWQQDVTALPSPGQDDAEEYDAIVSNPPYFTDSLRSPDSQRTLARHDDTLSYRTLATSAWRLLAEDGELSVVVPADQKGRMEAEAVLAGFFKSRDCSVKTSPRKPAKRCLLAFRKHPCALERTELTIGSDDYHELTKDFYIHEN